MWGNVFKDKSSRQPLVKTGTVLSALRAHSKSGQIRRLHFCVLFTELLERFLLLRAFCGNGGPLQSLNSPHRTSEKNMIHLKRGKVWGMRGERWWGLARKKTKGWGPKDCVREKRKILSEREEAAQIKWWNINTIKDAEHSLIWEINKWSSQTILHSWTDVFLSERGYSMIKIIMIYIYSIYICFIYISILCSPRLHLFYLNIL